MITSQTLKWNSKKLIIPQSRNGYMIVLLPLVLTVMKTRYRRQDIKILTQKKRAQPRFEAPMKWKPLPVQNLEAKKCSEAINYWLHNEWKHRCLEVRQINSSMLSNLPALISYTKKLSQSGLKAENETCRKLKPSWAKIVNIKPEKGSLEISENV